MSEHEWKVGDKAMLLVTIVDVKEKGEHCIRVSGSSVSGVLLFLSSEFLRPPVEVDPMAELRAAWVAWLGGISKAGGSEKFKRLEAAITAIEKARTP